MRRPCTAEEHDAQLSPTAWKKVQKIFGSVCGHSFDLMILDFNAQLEDKETPLPHFTPWATPYSQGINLFAQDLFDERHDLSNPYAFPLFALVAPTFRFMSQYCRPFMAVVPRGSLRHYWWPLLMAMFLKVICLARKGDIDALAFPSKEGYRPESCSVDLYVCRVSNFFL